MFQPTSSTRKWAANNPQPSLYKETESTSVGSVFQLVRLGNSFNDFGDSSGQFIFVIQLKYKLCLFDIRAPCIERMIDCAT